jgi:hypothetical protein
MDRAKDPSGGLFVIRARGRLNTEWMDSLEGFQVEDKGQEVVLTGEIVDHSALVGLMDRLYMLGLTLDSLERVNRTG